MNPVIVFNTRGHWEAHQVEHFPAVSNKLLGKANIVTS